MVQSFLFIHWKFGINRHKERESRTILSYCSIEASFGANFSIWPLQSLKNFYGTFINRLTALLPVNRLFPVNR